MAQIYDALGRIVENQNTANLTLNEIKGLISSAVKIPTGTAIPYQKNSDTVPSPLIDILKENFKGFKEDVNEQNEYLQQMVELLKVMSEEKIATKSDRDNNKKENKVKKDRSEKKTFDNLNKLAQSGLKKHSIGTHDTHCEFVLNNILNVLESMHGCICTGKPIPEFKGPKPDPTKRTDYKPPSGGPISHVEDEEEKKRKEHEKNRKNWYRRNQISAVQDVLKILEDQILGFSVLKELTQGIIDKERVFVQEARKVSYEISGSNKFAHNLMKTYEDIGKTTSRTGKDRQEFIDLYLKNIKKGIRDAKIANRVAVSQLNTEEQIGLKSSELGEQFSEWSLAFGLNENQLDEMGRSIRDIAKTTGITGENLKKAVTSSDKFLKNMQKSGTFSTDVAKQTIGLTASFEKFGASSFGDSILGPLTSVNSLLEANSSHFTLIARALNNAGLSIFEAQEALNNPAKTKKFINGLMQATGAITGEYNSLEQLEKNWNKLTLTEKNMKNIQMKNAFGVEMGEFIQGIKALEENSLTLSDKLDRLNKKKKENLTLEELAINQEEERKLKLGKSLEVLTALDGVTKSSKNMDEAFSQFGRKRKDFEKDMLALGQSWTSEADIAKAAINNAIENVNKGLKEGGKQELIINSSDIEKALKDPTAFRELTSTLSKAEQEASTAAKSQLDPLNASLQQLKEINDTLRNLSNSGFSNIFNSSMGGSIVALGLIASGVVGLMVVAQKIMNALELIRTIFGKPLPQSANEIAFLNAGLERGSIYTHDIHLEKILKNSKEIKDTGKLDDNISSHLIQIISVLEEIRNCICPDKKIITKEIPESTDKKATEAVLKESKRPKWTPEQIEKAQNAHKEHIKETGLSSAVTKSVRRNAERTTEKNPDEALKAQIKNIKEDKSLNKLERKNKIAEKKNNFVEAQINKLEKGIKLKQEKQTINVPSNPETSGIMKLASKEMLENAAAIALLGAGAVALGSAIVFLSKKILETFGLDLTNITQTAAAVAALAVAGGAIAAAGLMVFEKLNERESQEFVGGIFKNKRELLKIAASVAVIGPILVMLGASIVKMTQGILQGFNLDVSSTLETAEILGILGATAAGLFVAVSNVMESVEKMDKTGMLDWKIIKKIAKKVALGAAALLFIGPLLIGLGAAIFSFSNWILGKLNLDVMTIAKTTAAISAILLGAGAIAGAFLAASIPIGILGALIDSGVEEALLPLIISGAIGLLALAPGMVLLTTAIVGLSKLASLFIDLKWVAKTAMEIGGIIGAAGLIAGAILASSWALSMLGAFIWGTGLVGAFAAIGLMTLGGTALMALTPSIIWLSRAIIGIASFALGDNLASAIKTAEDVGNLLKAAGSIAVAVIASTVSLGLLGAMSIMAGWAWLMVGAGTAAIVLLTPAIVKLASSIIDMGKELVIYAGGDKRVKSLTESIKNISTMIESVSKALNLLYDTVVPLTKASWFGFGSSKLEKLQSYIEPFKESFKSISEFIKDGIINSVNNYFKNFKSIDDTSKTVDSVSKLIDKIKPIMSNLNESILPLTENKSWWPWSKSKIQILESSTKDFKDSFINIAKFINEGIVIPVNENFKKTNLSNVTNIINQVGKSIENVPKIVENVQNSLKTLDGKKVIKGKDLNKKATEFQSWFKEIASFIKIGIIDVVNDNIKSFKSEKAMEAMKSALPIIKIIPDIIKNIQTAMDNVGKKVSDKTDVVKKGAKSNDFIKQTEGFQIWFTEIIAFIKNGLIDPISGLQKETENLSKIGASLKGVGNVISTISSVIANIKSLMSENIGGKVEKINLKNVKDNSIIKQTKGFEIWFAEVANFLENGILVPTNSLNKKTKSINESTIVLTSTNKMLSTLSPIIENLSETVLLIKTKKELKFDEKIKNDYQKWFTSISSFVNEGILTPIETNLGKIDSKKVQEKLTLVSNTLTKIPIMISNLSKTVELIGTGDKGLINFIIKNKEDFKRLFTATANFVDDGVISPINLAFDKEKIKDISIASKTVSSMTSILKNIPVMIKNLSETMKLVGNNKLEFINDSAKDWNEQFTKVSEFLKIGIVSPILEHFDGKGANSISVKDISLASNVVGSMTRIIQNIPTLINKLSETMKLIPEGKLEKINLNANAWKEKFGEISVFLKEGIIEPITENFDKDSIKKISTASNITNSLSKVIQNLSPTINKVSKAIGNGLNLSGIGDLSKPVQEITMLANALEKIKDSLIGMNLILQELNKTNLKGNLPSINIKNKDQSLTSSPSNPVYGFSKGGIVPGTGTGDKVPAMLEPGELVVTNAQQKSQHWVAAAMGKSCVRIDPTVGKSINSGNSILMDILTELKNSNKLSSNEESGSNLLDLASTVFENVDFKGFSEKASKGISKVGKGIGSGLGAAKTFTNKVGKGIGSGLGATKTFASKVGKGISSGVSTVGKGLGTARTFISDKAKAIGNSEKLKSAGNFISDKASAAGNFIGSKILTNKASKEAMTTVTKTGLGLGKTGIKEATKTATKVGAKSLGKSFLKKIPLIGAIAGIGFGLQRAMSGDWLGAAGEMASGVLGTIPGLGTAASTAIDVGLAAKDMISPTEEIESETGGFFSSVGGFIADGASSLWSGIKSIGGGIADGFLSVRGFITDGASSLWSGIKSIGGGIADAAIQFGGFVNEVSTGVLTGAKSLGKGVLEAAGNGLSFIDNNIYGGMVSKGLSTIDNIYGGVFSKGLNTVKNGLGIGEQSTQPIASTLPQKDLHESVRQEISSNEPTTTKIASNELSEIVSNEEKQVNYQKEMVDLLRNLLSKFEQNQVSNTNYNSESNNESYSNIPTSKPSNYYRWKSGKHLQNAGHQILNIGAQTV